MNGDTYADKPPLLFWLIHLGWTLFGVNDWWPRLISPLASLVAMAHLYRLARRLGYAGSRARLAPLVLMSMLMWSLYSGALMFDVLLTACLLGVISPLAGDRLSRARAVNAGVWLGLALLAKGPVALLVLAPIVLGMRWWRATPLGTEGRRHLVLALTLGMAILLAWLLPAVVIGGKAYATDLLWSQSVDRLHDAMAHARPDWWYLPWLPVLAFPWSLWPAAWPERPRHRHQRLAWFWLLPSLLVFSLISGKQIHYLMPLLPALALLIMDRLGQRGGSLTGRQRGVALAIALLGLAGLGLGVLGHGVLNAQTLSPFGAAALLLWAALLWRQPRRHAARATRQLALASGVAVLLATQLLLGPLWSRYDVEAPGRLLAALELANVPVAFDGNGYQATFQFAGRLQRPLLTLDGDARSICEFQQSHPSGWLVGRSRDLSAWITRPTAAHVFDYRGGKLVIVPVDALDLGRSSVSCD
nr:glycosyltransferase family 39 protein [Salinicola sp. S1-1-2]